MCFLAMCILVVIGVVCANSKCPGGTGFQSFAPPVYFLVGTFALCLMSGGGNSLEGATRCGQGRPHPLPLLGARVGCIVDTLTPL